jgi:hypothetical protein
MGQVETEKRVWVSVDWKKMPRGDQRVPIVIRGPNDTRIVVEAPITNPKNTVVRDFVESNGYVSIEAEHYASEVTASPVTWKRIPGLGRTLSAMTVMPVTARSQTPGGSSPHLEYRMYLFSKGEVQVKAYLSPTLNFHNDGLRYAISFDDETAQVINMHAENNNRVWERWVANNINIQTSRHVISRPGQHVLKFWMVDPGVDLQKLVILTGPERPSYLGPPESIRITSGAR